MNRLELEKQIITEGQKRGITVIACQIYDMGDHIAFYPEVQNNEAATWIYDFQVKNLIDDLAPIERKHNVPSVDLDKSRYDLFKIGDTIEVDNIWIRLNVDEKEPKELIKVEAGCGQYRQGWVKGKVFETPAQNDRALGVKFKRDIYLEQDCGWIGDVSNFEKFIREGKIVKIEAGQPIWTGTHVWTIRKP